MLEFTASHYAAEDLFKAFHTNELEPRDEIVLCLDLHQRGLGGGSCGPDTLEPYRLPPGEYAFHYRLRGAPP